MTKEHSKEKKNNNKKINDNDSLSTHELSDSESDNEEKEIDEISNRTKNTFSKSDIKEHLITFIKYDDLIREYNAKIKVLKDNKKKSEDFLIKFMQSEDLGYVDNIDTGAKIIKYENDRKSPIKLDIIKDAIKEGIKTEKLIMDDFKCDEFSINILNLLDKKRKITKTVTLKRSGIKTKKNKIDQNKS